jgi:L-ascorbate metabolism protein UlaG (beta-lactamase superfamily)
VLSWLRRPDIGRYRHLRQPAADRSERLRATFLGVSTLLFRAGDSAILTDGFFTRPSLGRMLAGRIAPDHRLIGGVLRRLDLRALDAVIPVHSHYDHAMDAPAVAALTGAVVVGSPSTVNVVRGYGLPAEQVQAVSAGDTLRFGRFAVTLVRAEHSPRPLARGHITRPVVPPARASAYRMGECFSVLVECDGNAVLVNGSAGAVPGALRDHRADVVYFGVPTLGKQPADYRDWLWREVVQATGARRVIPVHWDDFWRPLDEPLVPMPGFADDFDATMHFLVDRCRREGVDLALPVAWQPTDPLAGLERQGR